MKREKKFEWEYEWLEAEMSIEELKKFLKHFSYELDEESEELPLVESPVKIGNCGGLKYFSNGREVVIAYNECSNDNFDKKFRENVLKWLIKNNIDFSF